MIRRRTAELLNNPGVYVVLSVVLVAGYVLATGFVRAVDAAGFNAAGDSVYDVLGRGLSALFGAAFVSGLFSEGPFVFILYMAILPYLLFLTVSSVFRLAFERRVGALHYGLYLTVSVVLRLILGLSPM